MIVANGAPNVFGGRMNLEKMDFMRQLNYEVCGQTTGFLIAEDSSAEWGITEDVTHGGLGFTFKWNMGWMNDTIRYMNLDPVYRKWHHGNLTHIADYAFTENYILVLSHDEVVYGKGSMVNKAPGSEADKMGEVKTLYTWQFTFPGKKLLFMGQEFAMYREWNVKESIDWHLADDFVHRDVMQCVNNLLHVYKSLCNFSPMSYHDYTVGVPMEGYYNRIFSTYDSLPGQGNPAEIGGIPPLTAQWHDCDGYSHMLTYSLRPFESVIIEFPTK